jgi:hypothetical protein
MATPKQVDLIIALWIKTGDLDRSWKSERDMRAAQDQDLPTLSQFTTRAREWLATLSLDQTRQVIGAARAKLGWQPETALASDRQRLYITDLEKRVYGSRRTLPGEVLTHREADSRIKYLKTLPAKAKSD